MSAMTRFEKVKSTFSKGKALAMTGLLTVGVSSANAAITFTEGTGFAGEFDLKYFYSAVGIIVTAIAVVAAIGLGIRQFRKI